jgi:uncharacterized membrane protein YbhN (UPF0104 family)
MSKPSANEGQIFSRNRTLGLILTAVIYLGAGVVVYFTIEQEAIDKALALPATVLLAMVALSLANYVGRAWRWLYLTKHLQLAVPARNNSLYYLAGYALTATPGKAGEAVRLWLLKSGHAVRYSQSLPLMFADRIVDMWAIVVLVFLSMSGFAAYQWQSVAMAVLVAAGSVPILAPRVLLPLFPLFYRWFPRRVRLIVKARKLVHSMADSIGAKTYAITLVPTVLGWFAECASLYVVLLYFDAGITLSQATFVFSFAMIVGALSMLPGGLGSTEATMVVLLKALGVDLGTALAATAIVRMTTFWFAVILGIACTPAALNAARRAARLPIARTPEPV